MSVTIKQWGNSGGVVIPAPFLKQIGAKINQEMHLEVKNGTLVLTPKRKRYALAELIQQCDPEGPLETEQSIWGSNQAGVSKKVW